MRYGLTGLATLILAVSATAQPPRDRRGPPDGFGPPRPGGGLQRAVEDLKLSERNRETALAAVRTYEEDSRRLRELAGSALLLKMKAIVSAEQFEKLSTAAERARGGGRGLTGDDVVSRLLALDKNQDGKVSKEDLPERMQPLVARGDANKDGALDRDEIKKLAADLAKDDSLPSGGRGGRFPPGPGGRGFPGGRGEPNRGVSASAVERAIDDLKLTGTTKEAATAAVKAHQEDVRKLTELARAEVLLTMGKLLTKEQLTKFQVALERPSAGFGPRPFGPPGRGFPGGGPPRGRPERSNGR
jgi:hypothetical protein